MKAILFALISFLVGGFSFRQTPAPSPISKIPPKIPVRDFFPQSGQPRLRSFPARSNDFFLQPWESRLNIFVVQWAVVRHVD